ncbi:DUF58 domain-containing protein [Lignipirellula cremea]|uniref:DUF58 domain-containing protein n=1 Tax=Lignipirellula cremea TaxID=2528010 RepID=A0A518DX79_9BACT|nr:DUF58 domain-containing protein [Lignipirellula cremea]QDU96456.1 hypothetical protein Pla8534_42770 [Lignipirellula cremea]
MSPGHSQYLDPKTLDRIKRLDVRARLVVEGFLTGQHRSPYNGFAVEFASHREYAPGDDIRHIDWKVWSKTDRLYIKEYEEETNLRCTVLLDASRSMRYGGDQGWSKFDYAATTAASLAYLMHHQQDAVGLSVFNSEVRLQMPPSSHPTHLKQLLHELEQVQVDEQTDVAAVFPLLASQLRRRGMVVLISDLFVDMQVFTEMIKQLRLAGHETVVMQVLHNDELTFPFQENTQFRGLEVDTQLNAEPRALRRSYLEAMDRFLVEVRRLCASADVDHVLLNTKDPLDAALAGYLSFRQKIRRRARR